MRLLGGACTPATTKGHDRVGGCMQSTTPGSDGGAVYCVVSSAGLSASTAQLRFGSQHRTSSTRSEFGASRRAAVPHISAILGVSSTTLRWIATIFGPALAKFGVRSINFGVTWSISAHGRPLRCQIWRTIVSFSHAWCQLSANFD